MNDWFIFLVGCFAVLHCAVAAGMLIYAIETDVKE